MMQKPSKIQWLCPSSLSPSSVQPRRVFDEDKLEELALSISRYGVLQPIIVRGLKNHQYEIIAGERRWRAASLARLKKVPCIISEIVDEDALAVALIENVQRENLNPIEEASAYRNIMESLGLDQQELGKRVGKSRASIANSLRLLRLPAQVQALLNQSELSTGHAKALLSLDEPQIMWLVTKKIIREGLSVRRTESLVRSLKNGALKGLVLEQKEALSKNEIAQSPMLREIQKKIEECLGAKTTLKQEHGGNYLLSINLGSVDQLNLLLDRLQIEI